MTTMIGRMFRPNAIEAVAARDRPGFLDGVERHGRAALFDGGRWRADHRRLRVRATRV